MPYASVADMTARFGATELIRMTTPEGQDMAAIDAAAVERAIAEADDLADSYLRKRYAVPLASPPLALTGAVCALARHSLAQGENREPTEQMRQARTDALAWLRMVADGTVTLDGLAPASTTQSGAQAADRSRAFSAESLEDW